MNTIRMKDITVGCLVQLAYGRWFKVLATNGLGSITIDNPMRPEGPKRGSVISIYLVTGVSNDPDIEKKITPVTDRPPPGMRKFIDIRKRPLLVHGMYGYDSGGPVILISDDLSSAEENVTLWHELLHAVGLTDEKVVEEAAFWAHTKVNLKKLIDQR